VGLLTIGMFARVARLSPKALRLYDDLGLLPAPSGEAGTTLTAMLWSGSELALVHIGDTRAYLLRDGELFQGTHDHTYVQSLVDEGRLTPEEARSHPQRALHAALRAAADPEQVLDRLIELAYGAGAPDNIACVVADVVEL
jgi:serine/threonine protein phosphatase PrpC